ncbi:MAG TPA: universal stress protein [Thermoanaerobaculia bacterium]|nr:universal stress protein [Thermoanaerobaculia bacterium]
MKPKTILLPTALDEPVDRLVEMAALLARGSGARLHLFHAVVLETPYVVPTDGAAPIPTPEELLDEKEKDARSRLESARRAAVARGLEVEATLRRGENAVASILEHAAQCRPDLVVVSSHGRQGLRRLVLGSVAEELVRRASWPVLVVRRDPELQLPGDASRVLAAIDFSALAGAVLTAARDLAATLDRELDLLHVLHVPSSLSGAAQATPFGPVGPLPSAGSDPEERVARCEERLRSAWDDAAGPTVPVRFFVRSGDPGTEILEHAREHDAGVLVLGTQGHSGLQRALFGSVCESVLRRAPCPVQVVPAGQTAAR